MLGAHYYLALPCWLFQAGLSPRRLWWVFCWPPALPRPSISMSPSGAIRLFALTRTIFRYAERLYNHDTVLRLLTDIRVTLFSGLAASNRSHRSARRAAQWLSQTDERCRRARIRFICG